MKKLTETDIINVFREEWAKRRQRLLEDAEEIGIQVKAKVPGDGKVTAISPGLKVKQKSSGLRYTIVRVDLENGDVILRKPDGEVSPIEPIAGAGLEPNVVTPRRGMMPESDVIHKFPDDDGAEDLGSGVIRISAKELEDEYVLS